MTLAEISEFELAKDLAFKCDVFGYVHLEGLQTGGYKLDIPVRNTTRGIRILIMKKDKVYVSINNTFKGDTSWCISNKNRALFLNFQLDANLNSCLTEIYNQYNIKLGKDSVS